METSNQLLVLVSLLAFVATAGATQFKVGGSKGWIVPAPDTASYNQWAARSRFRIGDSLVFVYPQGKDSVLVVNQDSYNTCNTSSYIESLDDGSSVFTFDRSGSFFFISGIKDNCLKKESLVVAVLSNRTRQSNSHSTSSPPTMSPGSPDGLPSPMSPPSNDTSAFAPSTTPVELTPPPPTGASVPAAPPSGTETNPNPSTPPAAASGETNTNPGIPSMAPSTEENPNSPPPPSPSRATVKIVGLMSLTAPLLVLMLSL